MTQPYDDKLWKIAQKRVGFRRHLLAYVLVNIALIVIWFVSRDTAKEQTAMTYWFLYPLCGWGIGVVLHYWNAYHDDDTSIEKEYNKIKTRMENRVIQSEDANAGKTEAENQA
jgi:hypothetical protein